MSPEVDPRVRHINYSCTVCGKTKKRDQLTVKRVEFASMGEGYKTKKRRTVGWICEPCLTQDPDWTLPPMKGSPGMANTKLNSDGAG